MTGACLVDERYQHMHRPFPFLSSPQTLREGPHRNVFFFSRASCFEQIEFENRPADMANVAFAGVLSKHKKRSSEAIAPALADILNVRCLDAFDPGAPVISGARLVDGMASLLVRCLSSPAAGRREAALHLGERYLSHLQANKKTVKQRVAG